MDRPRRGIGAGLPLVVWGWALIVAGCAGADRVEEARAAAESFSRALLELRVDGLPDDAAMERIGRFSTHDLRRALEAAREVQARFRERNPDEKPPWIEGDLFSSLFEGHRSSEVGEVVVDGDRAVARLDREGGGGSDAGIVRWSDRLVLRRIAGQWLIDDLEYGGDWPFRPGATLRDALQTDGVD